MKRLLCLLLGHRWAIHYSADLSSPLVIISLVYCKRCGLKEHRFTGPFKHIGPKAF